MDMEQIQRDPEDIRLQKIWDMAFHVRTVFLCCLVALFFGSIIGLLAKYESKDHGASLWCRPDAVVSVSGGEKFYSISDAVAAAPNFSSSIYCIHIRKGQYMEKVYIPYHKTNIALVGDGMNETTIVADGDCGRKHCQLQAATLGVKGHGFVAVDISIINNDYTPNLSSVAVENWSDGSIFYRCNFVSRYRVLDSRRFGQFYRECHIQGSGSLVVGDGRAFFQNCLIIIDRSVKQDRDVIALQSSNTTNHNDGFVFHLCNISATGRPRSGLSLLGAPLTAYARILYLQCEISLEAVGWSLDGFGSQTIFFAEYNNVDSEGSIYRRNTTEVHMLNRSRATQFSLRRFFVSDWVPEKVPHQLDLS